MVESVPEPICEIAGDLIRRAREFGRSLPTEAAEVEQVRSATLVQQLLSGDPDIVDRAYRHIEKMASVVQKMRADELKHGEAGMENRTARDIAQMQAGWSESNGSARSPEAVSAYLSDVFARLHAQDGEEPEKAAEEDGESAS